MLLSMFSFTKSTAASDFTIHFIKTRIEKKIKRFQVCARIALSRESITNNEGLFKVQFHSEEIMKQYTVSYDNIIYISSWIHSNASRPRYTASGWHEREGQGRDQQMAKINPNTRWRPLRQGVPHIIFHEHEADRLDVFWKEHALPVFSVIESARLWVCYSKN